jgi:hypothetical protein
MLLLAQSNRRIGRKQQACHIIVLILQSDCLLSPSGRRTGGSLPPDLDTFRLALRLALFRWARKGHVHANAEPTGTRRTWDGSERAAGRFLVAPLVLFLGQLLAHLFDVELGFAGACLFDDGLGEGYTPGVHGGDGGVAPDRALEAAASDHDWYRRFLNEVV